MLTLWFIVYIVDSSFIYDYRNTYYFLNNILYATLL